MDVSSREASPIVVKGKTTVDAEEETPDEHSPLLPGHTEDQEIVPSSRLHRKSKKGVTLTGLRRPSIGGSSLPLYVSRRVRRPGLKFLLRSIFGLLFLLLAVGTVLLLIFGGKGTGRRPPPSPFPFPSQTPLPPGTPRNPAYLIHAIHGAVSSESEACSNIGIDLLKEGGSAMDAAIGSTLCIGTINMFSSGIGGGGFLIVRLPGSSNSQPTTAFTMDFRETAPAASNSTMYKNNPLSALFGGLSVGIPGEIRGFWEAHKRWGKLPWKRLFEPSIHLARGWKAAKVLNDRLKLIEPLVLSDPGWKDVFAPTGRIAAEGDWVSRPQYAKTLATIAEHGPDAFYKGKVADLLIQKVRATGGIITKQDFDDYTVNVMPALEGSYRGRKVYTTHAPTSGPAFLHILNLLEHYDLIREGRTGLNVHRIVEASKFGYAARTNICDPRNETDSARISKMQSKKFAETIFPNIRDDTTHSPEYYHPIYDVPEDHGTAHVSVVDKDGMAVGLTSSINLPWGSQVLESETGIILNDEMDDFSTPGQPNFFGLWPSPYNYPAPGKRPLSSMIPTVMEHEDGSFYAVLGGSGGSRIISGVLQVLLNLDWGMDVSQAIEQPRVHDQLFPSLVSIESTYPEAHVAALRERNHNITIFDINTAGSVVQVVVRRNGSITAASDSRKYGVAAGY